MLVGVAVKQVEHEGQGGAVRRRAVLSVDLGVAMTRGALWHGRCARKRASAAVRSRRAGAEGCVECGGHGAASPQGRVGLLHGGDPSGSSPWQQWRGASDLPPLGSTSSSLSFSFECVR